jgi:hypothetical protein
VPWECSLSLCDEGSWPALQASYAELASLSLRSTLGKLSYWVPGTNIPPVLGPVTGELSLSTPEILALLLTSSRPCPVWDA